METETAAVAVQVPEISRLFHSVENSLKNLRLGGGETGILSQFGEITLNFRYLLQLWVSVALKCHTKCHTGMSKKLPHTLLRDGVYQFKRRVPTHLVATREFSGRNFIQFSMKTRRFDVAVRRLSEANQEFDLRVARAQSELQPRGLRDFERLGSSNRVPSAREIRLAVDGFYDRYLLENPLDRDEYTSRHVANNLE